MSDPYVHGECIAPDCSERALHGLGDWIGPGVCENHRTAPWEDMSDWLEAALDAAGADPDPLPELWDALPTALPHVELTGTGNDRSGAPGGWGSDLPGWDPWHDEDGRRLPVEP